MFNIVIFPLAEQDIEDIIGYLSQFYASTALRQYDKLTKAILSLEEFPLKFEVYKPGLFRLAYRKIVVENYLVFYVVNGDTVEIHRVLHGKLDIRKCLE